MRRAPVVLAATVAGVAATLGFHTRSQSVTTPTVATAAGPSTTTSRATASSRTVTGDAVSTRYGPVQLKVTVSRGRITDVQAVQLPSNDPKSSEIASVAAPQLRQSALTKQSANVDAVSGATYTSEGYKSALQSALDKAQFRASASSTA
jgi:uncharacterized protein with FMN-binding domain